MRCACFRILDGNAKPQTLTFRYPTFGRVKRMPHITDEELVVKLLDATQRRPNYLESLLPAPRCAERVKRREFVSGFLYRDAATTPISQTAGSVLQFRPSTRVGRFQLRWSLEEAF
jgi:hypothetical protein